MIYFRTRDFEIDLSTYGVSLNEESSLFTDNIYKSYSLPFTINADPALLVKLGLPTLDNVSDITSSMEGRLQLNDRWYVAVLYLGEIAGDKIECELSYGDEELPVYDVKLSSLPWPLIIQQDVRVYAKFLKARGWPEVGHNFPMVYDPSVKDKENYDRFEGWKNFYLTDFGYLKNVDYNVNVLTPCPYLLEILKVGYKAAGKTVGGQIFDDPDLKRALYFPSGFLEKFRGSQYQQFSFSTPTQNFDGPNGAMGRYEQRVDTTEVGTYEVAFKINLDPIQARYFKFVILRLNTNSDAEQVLYRASSSNNRVRIDDKVSININEGTRFSPIIMRLELRYSADAITDFNAIEFRHNGGQINEYPSSYTLADYMPDMKFGEYVNLLKNWLNLDISIKDQYVKMDFAQDSVLMRPRRDHTHLEVPLPSHRHNSGRFYRLTYANGESIFYNKNGQIYEDITDAGIDLMEIENDLQPLLVESNKNATTAVAAQERSALDIIMYAPTPDSALPYCLDPEPLKLQTIFDGHWRRWLDFRLRSQTYRESFECSVHEDINMDDLSYKYAQLHLIKKLQKKFINEVTMRVEIESETY